MGKIKFKDLSLSLKILILLGLFAVLYSIFGVIWMIIIAKFGGLN